MNGIGDSSDVQKSRKRDARAKRGRSSASGFMALEPRIMYDAAAVATAQDATDQTHHDPATPDHATTPEAATTPGTTTDNHQTSQTDASATGNIQAAQVNQLVVIDAAVADQQQLLDGLKPGEQAFVLNSQGDGVQQIADYIRDNDLHDLTAIQIVSHGEEGEIHLGSIVLSSSNIADHTQALAEIGASLAQGGDILLYGCNVASATGSLFLANLSSATGGADIAASTDKTGAASLGGNWTLERSTGSIEAGLAFADAALDGYDHLLASAPVISIPDADITRASTDTGGGEGNGAIGDFSFSADGTKIVFSSVASDLVAGDTNGQGDIFVKDLTTGTITLVSTNSAGVLSNGTSSVPSFSPDGTQVIFDSLGTNLVGGDSNGQRDVFIKDLNTGTTTRVSTTSADAQVNGSSNNARFSPDGTKVVFTSNASNLVAGDGNGAADIFVKDLTTGAVTLVSATSGGTVGNAASGNATFSPDGTKVAFNSSATNLVANDTNSQQDIFIKDLATGAITRASTTSADGQATGGPSANPTFSANGTKLVFQSGATNLVAGDTNSVIDIFVKDLTTGAVTRASTDSAGGQSNGASFVLFGTNRLSPDGNSIVFESDATNLVAGDTNGVRDIFIKNLTTGEITRLPVATDGSQGNGASGSPSYSSNGSVGFYSTASNLVANDTNAARDVFVAVIASGGVNYVEQSGAVTLSSSLTVSDADSANLASATVTISAGFQTGDTLAANTNGTSIAASYDANTHILTLSGSDTVAHYQQVLRTVTFNNSSSDNPTAYGAATSRTISWVVNDGSADSTAATTTVNVAGINDAPQIGALNAVKTATEQQTLEIDNSVNVSDADSATLASGTVTIGNYHSGEDTLLFTADSGTMGNITGSFDIGSGVLSLSSAGATATLAQWTAALRAVDYHNSSDTPDTSDRTITFVVNDGTADSAPATQTVHINAVNDAPTATITQTSYSATEQTNLTLHGTGLSVADVDGTSGIATLSVASGTLTVAKGSNTVTISGSGSLTVTITGAITEINKVLAGTNGATVVYNADSDTPPASTTLTLSFDDGGNTGNGGAKTGQDTATINIAAVNDAPTATITPTSYSATEQVNLALHDGSLSVADVDGSSGVATLSVGSGSLTVSAGQIPVTIGNNGTSSVTITGDPVLITALFAGAGGATVFYNANSDTPPSSTTLTLSYNDQGNTGNGGAKTGQDTATINIAAVNDAPVFSSGTTASVNEGVSTATTVYTAAATDPEGGAVTYSLTGGADAARFTINSSTGAVRFSTSPNFEAPTDIGSNNVYDIIVTASDGSLTTNRSVSITVNNVAPTFTSGTTASVNEGVSTSTTVYTAAATDPAGGTVTYSLSGTDANLFNINASSGAVTFKTSPNFESPTDNGGNNVYDITVVASDGSLTTNRNVSITVNDVAPTITSGSTANVNEGVAANTTVYTAAATDPAGGAITYSLTGTDASSFTINSSSGAVTINASPDFEAKSSYSFNVRAADPSGLLDTKAITLSVINLAPVFASGTTASINENVAAGTTVYNASAADPAGGAVTYSLTGVDAASFTINSSTGVVTINASPDFESKNSYSFTVVAADSSSATATRAVTLNILNVDEAPVFSSGTTASVNEGVSTATAVYTAAATDPEGIAISYSLAGADASLFDIDTSTGAVTFKATPNFETPADNGGDNVYNITVVASDGSLTTNRAVTITVNNLAPVISSGTTASIDENVAPGTAVYTAAATDPAGGAVTYSLAGADAGSFTIDSSTGVVTINASPDFETKNSYSFTVVASDSSSATSTRAVTLSVNDVNEAPAAAADSYSVNEDTTLTRDAASGVLANDSDVDTAHGSLQAVLVSDVSHGTLALNADGSFTYRPTANFSGTDSFTYKVNDGSLDSSTVTVTIDVAPVADAVVLRTGDQTPVPGAAETQVNDVSAAADQESVVAAIPGGGHVVVWTQGGFEVRAQIYDSNGAAVGGNIVVSSAAGSEVRPSVQTLAGGGFIVVWEYGGADGFGLRGQLFANDGAKVGAAIELNSTTAAVWSAVTQLTDGTIVAAWTGLENGTSYGVYARLFTSAGVPLGAEALVHAGSADDQYFPELTALPNGNYVVAWTSVTGGGNNAVVRVFDASGNPVTGELVANTTSSYATGYPTAVSYGSDPSAFVVFWTAADSSGTGVYYRTFDATGAVGSETLLTTAVAYQQWPSGIRLADGGVLVIWDANDGNFGGVYGQRFDADFNRVGGEFLLNSITSGNQYIDPTASGAPSLALDGSNIVATWASDHSGNYDVYKRGFTLPAAQLTALTTAEDTDIAIPLTAYLRDTDGSESLQIILSGFAAGTTFNVGSLDGGTGNWVISSPTAAELAGLVMTPAANFNGSFTLDIDARTTDAANLSGGATSNVADATASINVTVNSINDAPDGTDETLTLENATGHAFTAADFGFTDVDGNNLAAVRIIGIGNSGTLTLTGSGTVANGQFVSIADINAGKLVFTPTGTEFGQFYSSFAFQVQDDGGTANGGVNLDPLGNTVFIWVKEAKSLTVTTTDDVVDDYDGQTSLREAINYANVHSGADTISFSGTLSGQTFRFGNLLPTITDDLTIDGDLDNNGSADITITGDVAGDDVHSSGVITDVAASAAAGRLADNIRIFNASAALTIDGLVLTGGYSASSGGAIAGTDVTLRHATVQGNQSDFLGGGIAVTNNLSVADSTISNNRAAGGAGFSVTADNATVTIDRSVISGNEAFSSSAGGYYVGSTISTAVIADSTIRDNQAAVAGGGFVSNGSVSLTNTTISDNTALNGQGGGGIAGSLNATNVTVSGNTASNTAGGLATNFAMTLVNSTISGNTATNGPGGVQTYFGNLTLTNSIVLGNSAGGSESNLASGGALIRIGGNIIGTDVFSGGTDVGDTTAAAVFAQTATVGGVSAGVLADNGGPVATIALKRDVANPALDAGDDSRAPGNDARGVAYRDVLGVPSVGANIADLGAFEAEPENGSLTVDTANDVVDQFDNLTSLREAITYANSLGGAQNVDFSGGLANQTLRLGSMLPVITVSLTIDGQPGLTISGDVLGDDVHVAGSNVITDVVTPSSISKLVDNVQLFNSFGVSLTLNNLTLTGGVSPFGGAVGGSDVTLNNVTVRGNLALDSGGGVYATGTLNVVNSTISDNVAGDLSFPSGSGGGFYSANGAVFLSGTTVRDNHAAYLGGGFYVEAPTSLTIEDTTIAGNAARDGGGFYTDGSAAIARSTISGNSASFEGAGGATLLGALTASDTTFYGNDSTRYGAVYAASANLTNVTVSANTGAIFGGIYVTGNLTLANSIALGNFAAGPSDIISAGGAYTINGRNIVGNNVYSGLSVVGTTSAADVFAQTTTVGGVSAGVLGSNGGQVATVALKRSATNPALDASNSSASGTAANGAGSFDLNSLGNEGGGTNTRDLGAYEIDSQEAQSLTVTTLSDVADPFDDQTSLREAITYANNLGGSQTITFANGLSGGLIRLAYLLPTITTTVTFDGDLDDNGSADITITGDVGNNDLTVAGGITDIAASITANTLSDNVRIFNATAVLTVDGLVLTGGNDGSTASDAGGGAIRATDVTLTNATVQGNYAARSGGGVYASGNLDVTGSTISGNSAETGGGVFASGDFAQVTIGRSTISNNIARNGDGGGLGVTGSSSNVTVTDTTISGNSAASSGGGFSAVTVSLGRVTVSGNSAGGDGGGGFAATLTATNTTVSGNTASGRAGGFNTQGAMTLINSTVSGNTATSTVAGIRAVGDLTLTNSIVLGNSSGGAESDVTVGGTSTTTGGNIIGKAAGGADVLSGNVDIGDTTSAEVFAQTATVGGVQAGVLGDNGGFVQTVALRASGANPALDASNGSAPSADARGEARVDYAGVGNNGSSFADLGAYEVQVLPIAAATSGGTTASFEQIAVVIDAGIVVTNSGGATLAAATVSITGGFQAGEDVLGFANDNATMGDIAGSYSAGVLTLTSASGTATVAQWQAALRAVTYTNTSNTPDTSDRTISFSVSDGSFSSAEPTKTVSVTAINDAPIGSDRTVTADADTDYVFGTADFPYTDFESDGLLEVEITTLPSLGTLTLDGNAVNAGDFVSPADIAAGKLVYHPPADAFGHGYASFTFRVRDDGGTANNGENIDPVANTVTIDVRETRSLVVTTDVDIDDAFDGQTSLHEAILYANDHAGADTVTFSGALSGHTIRLTGLLPTITGALTIDGDLDNNGTADITITGDIAGDDVTVAGGITDIGASSGHLDDNALIFGSNAALTVDGLVLTGGVDTGNAGGAIRATSSLTLLNSTVAGNLGGVNGGGIYVAGNFSATDSTISGNVVEDPSNTVRTSGGGFFAYGGTITLTRTTVSGNTAMGGSGGGFYVYDNNAQVTIDQSVISGNQATFDGGGFMINALTATTTVTDSTISGNTANRGGGLYSVGAITIDRSTLSGNVAGTGGGGFATTVRATNVTIVGNSASDTGGFVTTSGDMFITNSTVTGNYAATDGRGGLWASANMTITNSIVLGNSKLGGIESNVWAVGGPVTLVGGNIIDTNVYSGMTDVGDTTAAAVFAQTFDAGGGILGGVLADNGGPVKTVALKNSAANPALDSANTSAPATDARGEMRADQPGVGSDGSNFADLGAFELPSSVPGLVASSGSTVALEQTASVVDGGITVTDNDSATLASATVSITGGFQSGEDALAFVNDNSTMGNITATYDSGAGVLTLSSSGASATLAQWRAALRAVTYRNSSDTPDTTDRTVSFVVNDGGFASLAASKTVTVSAVNDAPVNSVPGGPLTALEDVGLAITGLAVSDIDSDTASITVTLSVLHGTLAIRGDVAGGLAAGDISGNGTGTVTLTASAGTISATLAALNGVVYTSDTDYNGADTLTMTTNDGGATGLDPGGPDASSEQDVDTVAINVVPVNDVPSFTAGLDQTVLEDAGQQSVSGWATNLSAGPADEAGQILSFVVSNDNNSLFAVQPAIDSSGNLVYTPANDAVGTATVTVQIQDDGGTANGGVNTSATQTFTITLTPVNDTPSFTKGADQTTLEDGGTQVVSNWATGISTGPADEAGQSVAFVVSNDNNALFTTQPSIDANGNLTYASAVDTVGTATVTVILVDNGGTANGGSDTAVAQTFTITIAPVNDAPSFTKGADQTVAEDSGTHTVNGWATGLSAGPADEAGQSLSFVVTTSNDALFATRPTIDASGNLIYTLAADANGTATITVAIKDSGGTANGGVDTSATQSFTITITPVNDAPVIGLPGQTANFLVDTLAPVAVAPGVTVTDIDSATLDGVTVSITGGFRAGDTLNFVNQSGITGSYNAATGVLTLTGNASLAAYQAALAGVTFETTVRDPGQRALTWVANDGGAVDNLSQAVTSNIEVSPETQHVPPSSTNFANTGTPGGAGGSGGGTGSPNGGSLITSIGFDSAGSGFDTSGGSRFYINTVLQNVVLDGSQLLLQIPLTELALPLGGDIVSVTASLVDGSALPDWLKFDPVTGVLSGQIPDSVIAGVLPNTGQIPDDVTTGNLGQSNPPSGAQGSISIQVKMVDSKGNISTTIFTIKVAPQKGGWLIPRGLSPEMSPWGGDNGREHAAIELNRDLARLLAGAKFAGLAATQDGEGGDAADADVLAPRGRAGLSAQLDDHGWRSMSAERRSLLASLQRGAANWR